MASDPIPDAARWRGPPGPLVTTAIRMLTAIDASGRQYYRRGTLDGWRRLAAPEDFGELNAVIEPYREKERART